MRTITKTVYTFDELSDEAKENAYNNDHINHDFAWDDEYRETLNRFCNIFDVKMHNWEVDYGGSNYRPKCPTIAFYCFAVCLYGDKQKRLKTHLKAY